MGLVIEKLVLYGSLGILLECLFTGIHSLLSRNWRATCQTYLWMAPIYGGAALVLEGMHRVLCCNPLLAALAYVPIIYVMEFSAGWLLERALGKCPWHYGNARWGVMGLIRLDYVPYWFGAAVGFDLVCGFVDRLLVRMGGLA